MITLIGGLICCMIAGILAGACGPHFGLAITAVICGQAGQILLTRGTR